MSKQFFTTLGAAVVGVVAGAFLVTGLRSKPVSAADARHGSKETAAAPETAASDLELRALQARLGRLEAREARSIEVSTDGGASVAPGAPRRTQTSEEASAEWARHKADREAQVAAEPVDRAWSRHATAAFRKEFEDLGTKAQFTVTDVQCKTTSCLAKVRWDSYAQAGQHWRDVLHARYSQNCAREVFVPSPPADQTDAPYEASAFFDCTADRGDQAD